MTQVNAPCPSRCGYQTCELSSGHEEKKHQRSFEGSVHVGGGRPPVNYKGKKTWTDYDRQATEDVR